MRRFLPPITVFALVLTAFSAGVSLAATPPSSDAPLVADKVRQLMQDRNYAKAVQAIDEAMGVKDAPKDYLTYLKARALHLQDRFDDAVTVFDALRKEFPKSDWARRAQFGKAVSLARKGDFRSAELIYRAEAEYLLSVDRKQQIADLYLEFADAFFKPPKEEQKPDYKKALEFYQKALEVGPKTEKKIEIELLVAQCRQELKQFDEAIGLYEKFIKEYPQSPLDMEARYRLGECQLAKGNRREARRVWQDLLAKYADSRADRLADAAFNLSRTWGIPPQAGRARQVGPAQANADPFGGNQVVWLACERVAVSDEDLSLGVAALDAFLEKFPAHKLASQAHLDIAHSYLAAGRHEDAVKSLKRFLANPRYKDRPEIPDARSLLGRSFQLQKKFSEALATWQDFLAKHPAHKAWSLVQQEVLNTEYLMAQEKLIAKDYAAAGRLWSEFLARYPLDSRCPQILFQFGQMNYQQEKWDEAIADWRRLVSKYPGTGPAWAAQYMIAVTLEKHLAKLEEALEEYRKVTSGREAGLAQQAIARLTAKSLWIATERVFRSDETPRIKLVTRNVESVTVRAYKVDLETYFRKMHLARGVENLDIALIDPDRTFEFPVPKYAKHQELESAIELPLPGKLQAGVMAVTVTSKTLEATTLVLQSDLDVIVKSSRNELFVFAENMLTGKPWPGVRLLVSNGRQVFAEATTGADGVLQKAFKELADAADVRVFAVADGSVASNVVSLSGVGIARGLADKGYLYTDRPAYTAGQIVHVRGCVRHAAGDALPLVSNAAPMATPTPPVNTGAHPAAASSPQPPPIPIPHGMMPGTGPGQPIGIMPGYAPPTWVPNPPPQPRGVFPSQPAPSQPGYASPATSPAPTLFQPSAPPAQPPRPRSDLANDGPGPGPVLSTPRASAPRATATPPVAPATTIPAVSQTPPGDVYTVEQGKKFTLEVFDSRNRLVRQEKVALSAYGTFHTHFVLPPTSPQGQYRVLLRDEGRQNYQGTFLVHEHKIEPVHVVIDTPRKVYYRGEEIEGTIRAAFYYGAPLAGQQVHYQLADDRQHTATTDAKGEIRFKLPTREFREGQGVTVLPLAVTLPERNLRTATNFFLAARGFSIEVSTVRPVFVAGETFETTVTTRDAEGKPLAQKVLLSVLEKTTVEGKVGERLVQEYPVETAADGTARQTLKLGAGGRYVLRASGTDRFKNPVSGQAMVQVSDDEDRVRLRILAEKHTYKVGDTAEIQLHWREGPALALVTFQGARVLEYRLVTLEKGPNKLRIPMTSTLAPNFELSVAVMTDPRPEKVARPDADKKTGDKKIEEKGEIKKPDARKTEKDPPVIRFHTASSPFAVQRDLKLAVSYQRKADAKGPIRPGEELEVTVTTTDPQGKPVAAEVSLALVEQSLLDRFPWAVPSIGDFFRGHSREPAVRTVSSISFTYRAATHPINPQLLAEQDRLEVAKEEEASLAAARAAGASRLTAGMSAPGAFSADLDVAFPAAPSPVDALAISGETHRRNGVDAYGSVGFGGAAAGRRRVLNEPPPQSQPQAAMGRQTQSLRMMVTPGVVVEEEAAEKLGVFFDSSASFQRSESGDRDVYRVARQRFRYEAPTAERLLEQNSNLADRRIAVVDGKGQMQALNLAAFGVNDRKSAEKLAADLAKAGAVLVSGAAAQETGYWNPAIETGPTGKATMTFTVPERSTAWAILSKGITTETLAGEASEKLVVKKELFGELKLPLAFVDGDEAEVQVSVHNDLVEKGVINVVLKTAIGDRIVEEKKTVEVKSKGIHELVFKTSLRRPEQAGGSRQSGVGSRQKVEGSAEKRAGSGQPATGEGQGVRGLAELNVQFNLTVAAGNATDVTQASVPLRPYGMPVFATASGSATSDATAWVEAPKEMPFQSPSLQILVGPTVQRSLMEIVLGEAPWCQIESSRIASGLETAASDLLASLGLEKLLAGARESGGPQVQAIDARVRSSVSLLVSSQNDDGGWSWTGRGGASNRYASARVVWAMSLARAAGYVVPDEGYHKALAYLRTQAAAVSNSDYESKAILLHALSVAGQGDFALANRLYRDRPLLSPAALAYLALAFAEMDRKPTASELLNLLATPATSQGTPEGDSPLPAGRIPGQPPASLPWSHGETELRALTALAIQKVSPKSPRAKQLIDWLLAHRTGHRWAPDKATGPAALALCQWFAENRFEGEHYRLAVFVDDVRVKVLEIDGTAGTQVIDVPTALLTKAKQRVNFQITGRGQYTYQCILGGFVPAEQLRNTTNQWHATRHYEPAPLELDGREIPRGFNVLEGGYTSFRNPLTQLPVGRCGIVNLEIWRRNVTSSTPEEQLEYLVITEPIPSGTTVVENSVRGGFERFEVSPGAITFYVGSRRWIESIHYELRGYLAGQYRAGPTVIRNAYRPEQLVVSAPHGLAVLAAGAQSADKYRLTPQELYELGKRHFDKGNLALAQQHLSELVDKWNLRAPIYKEVVGKLLDIHLELGPPGKIVRYFEIIKEKWPAEEIPFAKIVKVGAAYHELGEYERSYLVFRATVESSFQRESGVAGFLESQGEFARSVDFMGRLLREYPPEAYVAAASYALAQRVYAKAPEAAADAKLRQQKINRVDLVRRAWTMLEGFLTAFPEDPAADQAAFATSNALLELKSYRDAAAACNRYAERYPKSELLDGYWYIIGYCEFATGQHEKALAMCRKVAETKRIDKKTGAEAESPNKYRAIYILGQVYHSLGKAVEAIQEYRRVEDRFADAKEAIEYFLHKGIELPEVTTVKPGEPAEVELKFRNLAACDLKVYRIDLLKFGLLKRNLGGITQINLAGIHPYHEATLPLGDGRDYRDRTHKLALPLKEEGAYLVVARGENLHASGLVLVTPLAVEVQEDAASGRVRTTVKDRLSGRYLHDVHVKVIGSRNTDFTSGATDLRGVFVSDGIQGTSTVLAQADPSRYAFFRGQTNLVPEAPAATSTPAPAESRKQEAADRSKRMAKPAAKAAPSKKMPVGLDQELLQGLQETNRAFQGQQVEQLKQMYQNPKSGVEAQKAY